MSKIIMHIDVNNAFLSWTALDLLNHGYNEDIRRINAIIGGDPTKRHGIVLAKSMGAKNHGVKTAETLGKAKSKCPDLKIFPPNYEWYQKCSSSLFELISKYTPDIEILSIDECFMDYTSIKSKYKSPEIFAKALKYEIYNTLGFTVNIGIGYNRLCAKMASDFTKPNKVHTLYPNEIEEKMHPLPVDDLFGCGKKSASKLHELHIDTISDLAKSNKEFLYKYFKNQASRLIQNANGLDSDIINPEYKERKGISKSSTLPYNLTTKSQIIEALEPLVEDIALSLRNSQKYAYIIGVNLKDRFFHNYSHQSKLKNATNNTASIMEVVTNLVQDMELDESIRLIGASATNLVDIKNHQISFFENIHQVEQNDKLEHIIDKIKKEYGHNIIVKASQKIKKT